MLLLINSLSVTVQCSYEPLEHHYPIIFIISAWLGSVMIYYSCNHTSQNQMDRNVKGKKFGLAYILAMVYVQWFQLTIVQRQTLALLTRIIIISCKQFTKTFGLKRPASGQISSCAVAHQSLLSASVNTTMTLYNINKESVYMYVHIVPMHMQQYFADLSWLSTSCAACECVDVYTYTYLSMLPGLGSSYICVFLMFCVYSNPVYAYLHTST